MNRPVTDIETAELDTTPQQGRAQVQATSPAGRKELAGRLAGLSLPAQVLTLAIWPLLEQLLGFMVGFVDTYLAGHLSVDATNAIGVAVYVNWLIGILQSAVGIGSTAIIARATGARHKRVATAALGQSMLMAVASGLVTGVGIMAAAPLIAWAAGLQGAPYQLCVRYLWIMGAAAPFNALLFVGAACLRGAGDTRSPFIVLVAVNLVNVGLAVPLVYAPAPWGGHGVVGMACAVFAAWAVGALLVLMVLLRGWGGIRLHLHRLAPQRRTMWRILRVGLPNLAEALFGMWVANYAVLCLVGKLPNHAAVGAHMIAIRLEAISYTQGFAIGIAAATLTGMYLGLGDPQRAKRVARVCWGFAVAVMFAMSLMFILIPGVLVRFVTDQPELLALSPGLLRTAGCVQVFFATAIVLGQAMRGAGDTATTLWLTICSTYGVRLPLAYLFGLRFGWGLQGIWCALCTELAFRGCLFAARFLHGGWVRAKV